MMIGPATLKNQCMNVVVLNFPKYKKLDIDLLPNVVLFDLFYKCYTDKDCCTIYKELNIDSFYRMLTLPNKRPLLIMMIQGLINKNYVIGKKLVSSFINLCKVADFCSAYTTFEIVNIGIHVGCFLNESGWYEDTEKILLTCKTLFSKLSNCVDDAKLKLRCYYELFVTQTMNHKFEEAEITLRESDNLVTEMELAGIILNHAGIYIQYSKFLYLKSNYQEAYEWSNKAINAIDSTVPMPLVIEIFTHASKACVVKRKFDEAKVRIHQAIYLSHSTFSHCYHKLADVLLAYGFYLLNSDSIKHSVVIYEWALNLVRESFGATMNVHVAIAEEDLAYALYVNEYSSGYFQKAMDHAEKAIRIMKLLLPENHLMLSSAKRVKALILEEIALDQMNVADRRLTNDVMLIEAEGLHKEALVVTRQIFGTDNVLTAKHYGNLGRLYQSMRRFQEAEKMHLEAIEIKERLLGPDDYEVGLSVGHLASLYNYHMKRYREAEALYLRSISINLKLFSSSYSGLEYDYRGLVHVYEHLSEPSNELLYSIKLTRWKEMRNQADLYKSLICFNNTYSDHPPIQMI